MSGKSGHPPFNGVVSEVVVVPGRVGFVLGVGAVAFLIGAAIDRAPAAPMQLASHRAVYSLKLTRANSNASVNAAAGRLVIEWQDTCDGYTTNQRFLTQFSDNEGNSSLTDLWVSSWESRDGSTFRFNLTNSANGTVQERSRGLAKRGDAKAGDIAFEEPKPQHVALPPGAIFPSQHTEELIGAAKRGEHTIERIVFDGGADNGISYVSAFIGKELSPKPELVASNNRSAATLTGGRTWPVRLAFYPHNKGDDMPDYEMAFLLHENGVSTGLEFDYGDFTVAADLSEIEALPGCAGKPPK